MTVDFTYNEMPCWNELLFTKGSIKYDLTFYPTSIVLYKRIGEREHRYRLIDRPHDILKRLKRILTEDEFLEVQKFFFKNL